jgi:arylsulfatase A-like enzyme
VTRVPWLIRAPGGQWHAGTRVTQNVSHVDVFVTLLELMGVSVPPHAEGKSVMPLIEGKEVAPRVSFMEFNLFGGQQCALFDGRYKLIYDLKRERAFMYDLLNDSSEQEKLSDTHEGFRALFNHLKRKRKELQRAAAGKSRNSAVLSDEARDALKSLGYIE